MLERLFISLKECEREIQKMLREVLSSTAHKLSNLKKSGTQDTSIMSWTLRERAKLFTHEKSALHKQYKQMLHMEA